MILSENRVASTLWYSNAREIDLGQSEYEAHTPIEGTVVPTAEVQNRRCISWIPYSTVLSVPGLALAVSAGGNNRLQGPVSAVEVFAAFASDRQTQFMSVWILPARSEEEKKHVTTTVLSRPPMLPKLDHSNIGVGVHVVASAPQLAVLTEPPMNKLASRRWDTCVRAAC